MEKIINRKNKYKIVLDCETCPIDNTIEGVEPKNMLAYDIGFAVVDKLGNVYESYSFIVKEIFLGEYGKMESAYYYNKLPIYWYDLSVRNRELESFKNIKAIFADCVERYHIEEVYAHNMRFDYHALNTTFKWVSYGNDKQFFPKGLKICDTLKFSHNVICKTPTYKKFCQENGYLKKNGQPNEKAETIYRYITKDNEFIESHTGLEDVLIEKEILRYCYSKHKKGSQLMWVVGVFEK